MIPLKKSGMPDAKFSRNEETIMVYHHDLSAHRAKVYRTI